MVGGPPVSNRAPIYSGPPRKSKTGVSAWCPDTFSKSARCLRKLRGAIKAKITRGQKLCLFLAAQAQCSFCPSCLLVPQARTSHCENCPGIRRFGWRKRAKLTKAPHSRITAPRYFAPHAAAPIATPSPLFTKGCTFRRHRKCNSCRHPGREGPSAEATLSRPARSNRKADCDPLASGRRKTAGGCRCRVPARRRNRQTQRPFA